jgi:hypothetical protein
MLVPDGAQVATAYFDAWRAADFEALGSLLADDVTFTGPLGVAAGAEECLAGMRQLRQIVDDIVVERMFVDGDDVLTWFALHTTTAGVVDPVVNWSHLAYGLIDRIRVTFDPRPLLASGQQASGQ